ncbi:MAG TPA: F0F1 ATP synthase subunit B [Acidimicrobiales bacterium]|nr:F0F1 ATP synthase subunit B [Acidimicrobiales bacterium]
MTTPHVLASSDNFGESFVLEWIALIFVAVFIWRYVVPFLSGRMAAKREQIRASLEAGEEAAAAAARAVAEAQDALASSQREAEAIVAQAHRSAEQLVADGRRRAEEDYERILARTESEVRMAMARVRGEVAAEVSAMVIAAAERVVEAELDVSSHHRLIDEAIAAAETETTH